MTDPVTVALSELVAGGVVRRELTRPDGRRLRWVEAGDSGPTVVLTAGAGEMALDWATVLPSLAERFHVVAYDRAGLGASGPVPRVTLDSQIGDLLALLDAVGPAVLVGHSWGGLLVQLTALTNPEKIVGLVLVDPGQEELRDDDPWHLRALATIMVNAIVPLKIVGLEAFGRLAACCAFHWATVPRYSCLPPRVAALRRSSREIVPGSRPRARAMSRTPLFLARRIAISSRSAKVR